MVSMFASLRNQQFMTALLHHLRKNLHHVPHCQRSNIKAVVDCFRDLLLAHSWEPDLFHEDLVSALAGIPRFIQDTLGRRSLLGTHLIFLLGIGDAADTVSDMLREEHASRDHAFKLAVRYLLAGKLFYSHGSSNPDTRHHVDECYKVAVMLNQELDRRGISDGHEWRQDVYHYLSRVGIWKVQCDGRQRTPLGHPGAEPKPPVGLLEESILYAERCNVDGPQSPIVIQALGKLRDLYEIMRDYMKAEMTTLRIQAVEARRNANNADVVGSVDAAARQA